MHNIKLFVLFLIQIDIIYKSICKKYHIQYKHQLLSKNFNLFNLSDVILSSLILNSFSLCTLLQFCYTIIKLSNMYLKKMWSPPARFELGSHIERKIKLKNIIVMNKGKVTF